MPDPIETINTMMNKINHLTILFFSLLVQVTLGQNAPVTMVPEVTCGIGEQINIPVTVIDFINIGALSLTLNFDEAVLDYQSFSNNSNFPGLLIFEQLPGKIVVSGLNPYGNPGITLDDNAVLFTLNFYCLGGATSLWWNDLGGTCEYADDQYNPLNDSPTCSFYKNGSVNYITINLAVKAYLEGPFTGGQMSSQLNDLNIIPTSQPYASAPWYFGCPSGVAGIPASAVDWILVELRCSPEGPAFATSDKKVAENLGFIMTDGTIRQTDGLHNLQFSVPTIDDLYIVIYHRNHVSVMASVSLSVISGVGAYDFSNDEFSVWGGNSAHVQLSPGFWGMAAGDSNGDGYINSSDKNDMIDLTIGLKGYLQTDVNFDSQVNNMDKNDFWAKNLGFYSKVP